jgi:acetyl-CoA acyltransferase
VTTAVLIDAVRTPSGKGKPGGGLAQVHPATLLAMALVALLDRNDFDPVLVDDVIAGCVTQSGEQAHNVGRTAVLAAGMPESVPATTVDRQCGSSQQAVHFAAQGVLAGAYDAAIACGVESMSRVPMFSNAQGRDATPRRFGTVTPRASSNRASRLSWLPPSTGSSAPRSMSSQHARTGWQQKPLPTACSTTS